MENFDTDKFCERAIALFGDSGQMELAEKIGISQGVISAIKNKKVKAPGAYTICRLSKYFGVSSDYLLGLAKDPTTDTDLKAVCDYTGLSVEAIDFIKNNPRIDIELLQRFMSVQQQFGEMLEILNYKK